MITRRAFLQLSVGLGALASVDKLTLAHAASAPDYKALVCVFLQGGNDGHNTVVPLDNAQYAAYQSARGVLALPPAQLLQIQDPTHGAFGLHVSLAELQGLFNLGKLAIVANVGVLVEPTMYADLSNPTFPLPLSLRSHGSQVASMQSGNPYPVGNTGWGGRLLDQLDIYNAAVQFPVAISMDKSAIYCAGDATHDVSLQPGNDLVQQGLQAPRGAASQARIAAQQRVLAANSGNAIVNAANGVMAEANLLSSALSAIGGTSFPKVFPSGLGDDLEAIARIIGLNAQRGAGRQIFFCNLNGFDTHSAQTNKHSSLLEQVSKSLDAFYAAVQFQGLEQQVTAFTLSDFGRTLTPSGTGSDHGWGNHHLVLGGAVEGGKIYGRFPLMTNYGNFNALNYDFADGRGSMLPSISLAQYGGTLARWFGATDAQIDSIFPQLAEFATRDLGFLA